MRCISSKNRVLSVIVVLSIAMALGACATDSNIQSTPISIPQSAQTIESTPTPIPLNTPSPTPVPEFSSSPTPIATAVISGESNFTLPEIKIPFPSGLQKGEVIAIVSILLLLSLVLVAFSAAFFMRRRKEKF